MVKKGKGNIMGKNNERVLSKWINIKIIQLCLCITFNTNNNKNMKVEREEEMLIKNLFILDFLSKF